MIRRPPRSTQSRSSAASDVYKRQAQHTARPSPAGEKTFPHTNLPSVGILPHHRGGSGPVRKAVAGRKGEKGPTQAEKEQQHRLMEKFWYQSPAEFLLRNKRKWREKSDCWPPLVPPSNPPTPEPNKKTKHRVSMQHQPTNFSEAFMSGDVQSFLQQQHKQWRALRTERSPVELFCCCRTPYDDDLDYLGCDSCEDWFHIECVGISKRMFRKLSKAPGGWSC
eukprot:TRINITY_DN14699_c0_g1_i1.p1 TRINITY_DN14699_c0_g1~~TRINITY_DN14699_c0_g1_i1.p1  ORF type:complete len:222 (+),score=13.09 TRINITY_DN14699_c0_g1_i1:145-810(+)